MRGFSIRFNNSNCVERIFRLIYSTGAKLIDSKDIKSDIYIIKFANKGDTLDFYNLFMALSQELSITVDTLCIESVSNIYIFEYTFNHDNI